MPGDETNERKVESYMSENAVQANLVQKLSEEGERDLIDIIERDDEERFRQLLEQGLSPCYWFDTIWALTILESDAHTVPQLVIKRNALKVADHVFALLQEDWNHLNVTALTYAVREGSGDMVRLMIDKGFDPDKGSYQDPPLWLAVIAGRYECCEALVSSGKCNPYLKSRRGGMLRIGDDVIHCERSPLGDAARQGRLDIVRLIVEFKMDKKALADAAEVAARYGHEDVALYLLDKLDVGRKPGDTRNYPYRMATWAVAMHMFKVVDRLLEKEPRVLQLVYDSHTMLSAAAQHADLGLVKRLMAMGAEIQTVDKSKYYVYDGKEFLPCLSAPSPYWDSPSHPLAAAARGGKLETVKYLVEQGSDPDTSCLTVSGFGGTPAIELAEQFGHAEIVAYLASLKAS